MSCDAVTDREAQLEDDDMMELEACAAMLEYLGGYARAEAERLAPSWALARGR